MKSLTLNQIILVTLMMFVGVMPASSFLTVKEKKEDANMNAQNNLTNVTDADFEREVLSASTPVLVEFGADWCGPCHIVAPVLKELATEFQGKIKVCQVDVDANPKVTAAHGVQGIPTFLYFRGGDVVDRSTGVVSKEVLTEKFNALLEQHQEKAHDLDS